MFFKKSRAQEVKSRARRNLSRKFSQESKSYVLDTSAIINRFLHKLINKGLKGKIIIPNAVMAELENMANKGREEGFIGLEEISLLHKRKDIKVIFAGSRPGEMHIKYAKSGEIDALIRDVARKFKAILITADLVQAKSSQAYGLEVIFLRPKIVGKKKSWFPRIFKR